ncbi:MAG: nucleotidyltransferase domain-containing protein [Parcubacteria group bacterium]|nr:nucleotidyltransferase domain-containing protein [Parcubacteria group bacterium]
MTKTIEEIKQKLAPIFEKRKVALAYLFGSRARGNVGPLSDVDIAVVFSKKVPKDKQFDLELSMMSDIGSVFKIDRVDVVNLETCKSPLLKHRAVFYAKPLYVTDEEQRFMIEQKIRREYEDTNHIRETQYQIMRRHLVHKTFGKPEIYVPTR